MDAAVFDMDGVLVDSAAHHRAAWRELLDELGARPSIPEFWRLTIGRPSWEAVPLVLGRPVPEDEARRIASRKQALYLRLAGQGLPAVPGAVAFVVGLARSGVPRAVATSASRPDMLRMLGALDLLRLFDIVVTAEDVRLGKPDPEVYLRAAHGLGLPAGRCLAFEDSVAGVTAALGAGMRVIGVATTHAEAELLGAGAERVIPDFEGCTWPA